MKKFMKRILKTIIPTLALSLVVGLTPNIKTNASTLPPQLNAEGAILIEASTGKVLYSKNGEKQFFPASTTKMLTAIIVLENSKLDEKVTISWDAAAAEGSSIGLREGEVFTVENLLEGLLLMSGNDCAYALAEHVGGTIENFSKMMNKKAKELGATNSNFKNPSGLPDPEHLTTPRDLALIMAEGLKHPDIIKIGQKVVSTLPPSNIDGHELNLANHNYLVNKNSRYYYPYAVAGKNGYTIEASHTFTISAQKDGQTLVAAFLKASDRNQNYLDMATLFDYGFNNFKTTKLYSKGDKISSVEVEEGIKIPLLASKDIYYTHENSKSNFSKEVVLSNNIDLTRQSIEKGQFVSTAKVTVDGEEIATLDLISGANRPFDKNLALKYTLLDYKYAIIFFVLFVIALILFTIRTYNLRKRKSNFKKKYHHIIHRKRDTK